MRSIKLSILSTALIVAAAGAAHAQTAVPVTKHQTRELRRDHREVVGDKRDLKRDSLERAQDRREIRSDLKSGEKREAKQDTRDLRADRRDTRTDRTELSRDKKDAVQDRRRIVRRDSIKP